MEFQYIQDKNIWNQYIHSTPLSDGGFLQSWEWGEFQESFGRKVFRLACVEDKKIVSGWQIIFNTMPLGFTYAYIPRPLAFNNFLFEETSRLAKKEKAIFIRFDAREEIQVKDIRKLNFSVQPEQEFAIDITKSEETLLSEMKSKTRYNIRLAQKHGVLISHFQPASPAGGFLISNEIFDTFFHLVQKTCARQNIKPHPREYYKKMIEILSKENVISLYLAKYKDVYISGALMVYSGDVAYYLHGGSDDADKNVMAPYFLHWQAILDAKSKGIKKYNFGGVSLANASWEGITRFKFGFSPETRVIQYGKAYDLSIQKFWYRMYRMIKNI